mgnify:CR=1 FL=1
MLILIESPKHLLPFKFKSSNNIISHGANNISKKLLDLFINDHSTQKIIVSDLSETDYKIFDKETALKKNTYLTTYKMLKSYIESSEKIPDICINFDSNITKLIHFRNINKYTYPIIGLIHSLGFYSHFKSIEIIKRKFQEYDTFICPSKNTQQSLINFGFPQKNTTVIRYGVDSTKFKPTNYKNKLRKELSININSKVILTLGRISPGLKTDLTPIFKLLPNLIKNNPELILYIVGTVLDKSYVIELKNMAKTLKIENHIIWEHHPDHKDIQKYYQVSDIFISLSDCCGETFGLTVLEAMSTELPVIISKFAGYKNHLNDKENGFYISSFTSDCELEKEYYTPENNEFGEIYSQTITLNYKQLKSYLLKLIQSKDLRKKVGQKARKTIKEKNSLEIMLNSYKNQISLILNKKNKEEKFIEIPNYINISNLFSHQCSHQLTYNDPFYLTKITKEKLKNEDHFFFFENQLSTYDLITPILFMLNKEPMTINQLANKLQKTKALVAKNCLFLLKQTFIKTNLN